MIVILDCHLILSNIKWLKAQAVGHYKLSSNRLYEASKHLPIYWLEKSVTVSLGFS